MKWLMGIYLFIACAFCPNSARTQALPASVTEPEVWLALDSFDYPTGAVAGSDGGLGFKSGYTGLGWVGAGSLSYTDTNETPFSTTGGRFTTAGSHNTVFRELATNGQPASVLDNFGKFGRDGAVIYVAFLTGIATGDNTGYGGFSLFDSTAERLFFGDLGFAFLRWGYDPQGGSSSARESSILADTTTRLLVGRIDFASGSETIRLYVDPPLDAEPVTASAGPSVVPDFRFTRIRMASGPQALGPGGTHHFDEIRIGTNYAQVVAPLQPRIGRQPASTNVVVGQSAHFSATAVGPGSLSFQWYFNGTIALPNATNFVLSLTNVHADSAGSYHVVVSNAFGMVTSAVATLTVLPCLPVPPGMVSWWPGDGHANDLVGTNHGTLQNGATFAVGEVGQSLSFDGVNDYVSIRQGASLFPGSNSCSLSFWIQTTQANDAAIYILYECGGACPGSAHSNFGADLVNGRLRFSLRDTIGNSQGITSPGLVADGQWHQIVGIRNVTAGQLSLFVDGVSVSNAALTVTAAIQDDDPELDLITIGALRTPGASTLQDFFLGRLDEVQFYNRALTSSEIAAIYTAGSAGMCKPPVQVLVGRQVVNTNVVTVTNSAMVELRTTFPSGHIFYTLNGASPGTGLPYTGPVLVTTSVVVRAIAYNADYTEAEESDPITISMVRSPVITQPPQTQTVLTGQGVMFSAQAAGDPPLSYQWFFNGAALAGATSSSFTRDGALLSHGGSYWVVASNPYGSATSEVAGLTVLLRPSIATQPSGTNVNTGQNATFCVSAIGSAPLAFRWRRNGVNLPAETNSCLSITNVQAANAGAYSVVVGNGADAVTSAEAVLTLQDVPTGPAPDNFADRFELFGSSGSIGVTNIGATKEIGEPDHAGKPGTNSVWYSWTAETDGIATFQTTGSAFDTLLAVYVGEELTALTPVASNEDGGGSLTSQVRFNATNGATYQIALDGFAGAQGDFILSWSFEETTQVLPVIGAHPVSLTVTQGGPATFTVSASGTGLKYQWYFNSARLNNETNSLVTRTNVEASDVGYYAVAVTNDQSRGLLSEAAVLEIGPFANVRSVDKVEDLLGGLVGFQPASGFASVTIGSLGTQVLNTTNSTTSFRETNHCGVIGGSSRWFKLKAAANGLMSVDTLGSTFDTVLAAYTGDPLLGGYPTKLIECNNNAAADVRWSRVLYPATNAIDYLIAVDGAGSAAGTVQLNWSLGLPPVLISNPPPTNSLWREGEALQLTTALTNGLPPPQLQWYLDGQPIPDATNATYDVTMLQRVNGGIYTVVAYNPVGVVTSIVANVSVEVPLKLNLQPVVQDGAVHIRVSGVASQTFILQGSTNFVNWQPLYTNSAAGAPVSFDDHSTTNRARRYYRALPWP